MCKITYIILAAGKGKKLYPLTLKYPKTSYKLDKNTTVLQRMVRKIREHDRNAEIVIVLGYRSEKIKQELADENVKYVINPFFEVTNSISSLWFARDYLERENVTILHSDVVFSDELIHNYLVKSTSFPHIFVDSSRHIPGAYNVILRDNQVIAMSNKIENFNAKYCCTVKLDPVSSRLLKQEIDDMIAGNMYDQYYEDSLVQMIMFHDFQLNSIDIAGEKWAEVDTVDDLLTARQIHQDNI